MEPNKGPNVKVIADIAAPIEKKAMTEAKIFPPTVTGACAGPSAVAKRDMKYNEVTGSQPSSAIIPMVPMAITMAITMARIMIEMKALFLNGDRGCRTILAIPPSFMSNQLPLKDGTLALSIDKAARFEASL